MNWLPVGVTLSFLVSSGTGQVDGQPAKAKQVTKKIVQMGVAMSASIVEQSVAGSEITLRIHLTNEGNDDVGFTTRTAYWDFDLKIADAQGDAVPHTRFGKLVYGNRRFGQEGSSLVGKLAPGKAQDVTLNLARVFDLTQEGKYSLTVTRQLDGGRKLNIENMEFTLVDERSRRK